MRAGFGLSIVVSLALAGAAQAQGNSFTLISMRTHKPVGRASYTIEKAKNGLKVKTRFEYKGGGPPVLSDDPDHPDKAPTTEAQYTGEFSIDANGNFSGGYLQNSTNQMLTSFTPSKERDVVTVGQVQAGTSGMARTVTMPKPDYRFGCGLRSGGHAVAAACGANSYARRPSVSAAECGQPWRADAAVRDRRRPDECAGQARRQTSCVEGVCAALEQVARHVVRRCRRQP